MRIIFMGTPDFAVPCLRAVQKEHEVVSVITQPDKAQGRGRKVIPSAVKKCALELGLRVDQPDKINNKEFVDYLQTLNADLIIVVAYGQLLRKRVLSLTPYGAINIHASLLPKWRGGAPIHRAILNGDKETGVSIMRVERKLDTGAVYASQKVEITDDMNVGKLHDILADMGADMLVKVLRDIDNITPEEQDHEQHTYAELILKEDRLIDWSKTQNEVFNRIRGLNPWPVAYSYFKGKQIQIWASEKVTTSKLKSQKDGQIIDITPKGPLVKCSNGALILTKVKPAGKKLMSGSEFCRGYRCDNNDYFGEREE